MPDLYRLCRYYLLRKNFSLAMPYLVEQGYSRGELGVALSAVAIAYGLSKFLMGLVSDRSNPRYFLPFGLVIVGAGDAAVRIRALGYLQRQYHVRPAVPQRLVPGHGLAAQRSHHGALVVAEGAWRGGFGSVNVAHNVGGGLIGPLFLLGLACSTTARPFYVPAVVALAVAAFAFIAMRDTPQSCGLPSVEHWKQDFPEGYSEGHEREFSTKEIFVEYVLKNRLLWYIAFANVFVYLAALWRADWAPTYLKEAKHFSVDKTSWPTLSTSGRHPGTLLCGCSRQAVSRQPRRHRRGVHAWRDDRHPGLLAQPGGNPGVDLAALVCIGFLIYGPVMLIGLQALELVPKKAAGTAAGFTGLFGYLGAPWRPMPWSATPWTTSAGMAASCC